MRYSKSSILAIALTVACSATDFSAVANAQDSKLDFPWRSKTSAKAAINTVKSAIAKPARDLTTSQTIDTPTPTFESMPSVIYDEGKKYVRRGDTYVESPGTSMVSGSQGNYAALTSNVPSNMSGNMAQIPAVKKSSLFQKTKDLTGRLNPFSKSLRSDTQYRSADWKVPSFSDSLSPFSKKDNDPITFAAVTPLPAKSSVPAPLDSLPTTVASTNSYNSPAFALPARDSQFKSALPTETKVTSIFATKKEDSPNSDFQPDAVSTAASSRVAQLPSSFSPKSKISSTSGKGAKTDFDPVSAVADSSKFSAKSKLPTAFPVSPKKDTDVINVSEGFTFTQETSAPPAADTETKSNSPSSIEPEINSPVSKSAKEITEKVSQDFSPKAEITSEIRREVSKIQSEVVKPKAVSPVRIAHALSVDDEFWSPKR